MSVHPNVLKAAALLSDGDIEEAMEALAQFFDEDAARNSHPAVKALLESCRDSARSISFEWYASFKQRRLTELESAARSQEQP